MNYFKIFTLIFIINISAGTPLTFFKNNNPTPDLSTPEYLEIIRPFLPKNPSILEAGADQGEDTVLLAKNWPHGIIYAFEPHPLHKIIVNHRLEETKINNVLFFPLALASSTEKRTFYCCSLPLLSGASSLLQDNNQGYQDISIAVDCINLDEWAIKNNVNGIDFMWLDMEGGEYEALSNAPKILKTVKVIITELNCIEFRKGMKLFDEFYNFLKINGFELYKSWGNNPEKQCTGLFIRSELLTKSAY
ncbi:TPA: hypothetical protein DIC20_00020 [Candidatus Dependentiae bacterium]|nr:MAG: hypothetical protein US03_C0016G0011 [candidate division TM6 bacterium GW2011_GWF2_36_131]KKQ02611.1 MAG: hypothetical protein US13_C0013G0033 [candidate division TM6 bacterium GW2011_GWE2_36_25]KKQ19060.1 MAG: hypothetical protein US32_C0017G0011 [candidate division TM6 bacterium GW2011_GWA2_36_9]HBR70195.1 hypothetical protein [Candidatus Dependentiae bacterium]HCU00073.1 hypothetical protein [Candidatus Dependentiae bacterium]